MVLAGCTKNEVLEVPSKKITFSTPIVKPVTKAIIDGTTYPEDASFGVFAWYSPSGNLGTETGTVTEYMNNVNVSRDAALRDDLTESSENGGWEPTTPYYWPKTGSLTFDAYSPYSISSFVDATSTDGITIKDYVVVAAADVDVLYATRALNKTTSSDDTSTDTDLTVYDGVDIPFHHALAAVYVTAKTDAEYSRDIKITSLKIVSAHNKSTFSQGESKTSDTDRNTWGTTSFSDADSPVVYTYVSSSTKVPYVDGTTVTSPLDCGHKILLPQTFSYSGAKIEVDYTIGYGDGSELAQSATFELKDKYKDTQGNDILFWDKGKKYTYNIVFGLKEIFFEPSVTEWVPVTVGDLTI